MQYVQNAATWPGGICHFCSFAVCCKASTRVGKGAFFLPKALPLIFPFCLTFASRIGLLITQYRRLSSAFGPGLIIPNSRPRHRVWDCEPGVAAIARNQIAAHILG